MDPAGNAIVVWTAWHEGRLSGFARRYRAAANTWDPVLLLETDDTLDVRAPSVATDASGNAIVAWAQNSYTEGGAWARRFDAASGAWQGAVRLDDGAGIAGRTHLAMDPGGEAIVAWDQEQGGVPQVRTARYTRATGTWGSPLPVADGLGHTSQPLVAINANGRAVVAFSVGPLDTNAAISNAAGNGWNTPVGLETTGAGSLPQAVAIDGFANATVLWDGLGSARHDGATGTWTPLPAVTWDGTGVRIGMDAAGNILATWVAGGDVQVRKLAAGAAAWGPSVPMEIDSGLVVDQQSIAVTPDGRAIVAWVQLGGGAAHALVNVLR